MIVRELQKASFQHVVCVANNLSGFHDLSCHAHSHHSPCDALNGHHRNQRACTAEFLLKDSPSLRDTALESDPALRLNYQSDREAKTKVTGHADFEQAGSLRLEQVFVPMFGSVAMDSKPKWPAPCLHSCPTAAEAQPNMHQCSK